MACVQAPDTLRWYVVRTKPKQEARADSNLRFWRVETLAPHLREPRAPTGSAGSRYQITPLFPGYIFARFDVDLLLSKVRRTRGVHDVVGFGAGAAAVDDGVIDLIRSRIGEDGYVHVAEPRPGDTVRIEEGSLRSFVGIFERELRGQDRVVILLTTIAAQARVEIAKTAIRRIAEPAAL